LLSASPSELTDLCVPQGVRNVLHNVQNAVARVLRHELLDRPLLPSSESVISYLHGTMAHLQRETFCVLFLDASNGLIRDEIMWEGSVSRVQIHPREVIRAALACNATAMIVAHNHPSGDPRPSRCDINITRQLCFAAQSFDMVVHDHLIIARSGWCSLRTEGFMGAVLNSVTPHANQRATAA
jgi:DNA repair protein RadC